MHLFTKLAAVLAISLSIPGIASAQSENGQFRQLVADGKFEDAQFLIDTELVDLDFIRDITTMQCFFLTTIVDGNGNFSNYNVRKISAIHDYLQGLIPFKLEYDYAEQLTKAGCPDLALAVASEPDAGLVRYVLSKDATFNLEAAPFDYRTTVIAGLFDYKAKLTRFGDTRHNGLTRMAPSSATKQLEDIYNLAKELTRTGLAPSLDLADQASDRRFNLFTYAIAKSAVHLKFDFEPIPGLNEWYQHFYCQTALDKFNLRPDEDHSLINLLMSGFDPSKEQVESCSRLVSLLVRMSDDLDDVVKRLAQAGLIDTAKWLRSMQ